MRKIVIASVVLAGSVALATSLICGFRYWAAKEDLEHDGFSWVYRSKYFAVKGDGCSLLDQTLGASAANPSELLRVVGWSYNENPKINPFGLGDRDFFDVQHQALVRLLALQPARFGITPPPPKPYHGGMDHTGATLIRIDDGICVVSGSASVYPDSFDDHPWEGYFRWETFRFTEDGKFVDRSPSTK